MASQPKTTKKTKKERGFDPQVFLATVGLKRTIIQCRPDHKIFSQGDPSDAVFYIQKGRVKLTIIFQQGKKAVIAVACDVIEPALCYWLLQMHSLRFG